MKRLLSAKYTAGAVNLGMFLLRVGLGVMMIPNGYNKLVNFATYKKDFMSFLGLGSTVSFGLLVFAEFFCAGLVILGFVTRLACIPLVIAMIVAVVEGHKGLVFSEGQHAALFALGFLVVAIIGPGRISVDGVMRK